ncbi:hypothetical protein [Rhodocyclus gracilis]|uniref:Uncharacterized protein n=1 Tax=Rhodocyclus tenuis TaxID=1066 RepID=A0A6L5JX49_RHOTE|nr:hypothetical protein [Rhodocyclus gracilis]MQY50778.1 hypothetical protein [Rhodocyclus gracilis]
MEPLTIALGLAQIAPSLMRYFGIGEKPVAIAEQAIALAKSVTGATSGEQALAALQADPKLAQEYQLAVLKADADLEAAYLADRQSARDRDIKLHQAGYANKRADLMVLFDVIGLVACLVVLSLFRADIPGEVVGLLSTIAGIFGLCLRDAHQFEFGSSRGSRDKDVLLNGGAK